MEIMIDTIKKEIVIFADSMIPDTRTYSDRDDLLKIIRDVVPDPESLIGLFR